MSQLSRVLCEYDAMCLEKGEQASFRHELASTLLASSRFSDAQWKSETICRTKQLLKQYNEPYINAWLAYRESAVMRMSGRLRMSLAESSLQRKMYAEAGSLLADLRQAFLSSGAPDYTARSTFPVSGCLLRELYTGNLAGRKHCQPWIALSSAGA